MSKVKRQFQGAFSKRLFWLVGGVALAALLLLFVLYQEQLAKPILSSTPTPSVSSTASQSVTPTPTATNSSPAASGTPSPSAVSSLNTAELKLIDDFYAAYKTRNGKALLSDLMTAPNGQSELELQSLLWKGVDLQGVQGGPTLFVSSVASAVVQSYTIKSERKTGSYWEVSVEEKATIGSNTTTRQRILEVTGDTKPLIARYYTATANGKYAGFLN